MKTFQTMSLSECNRYVATRIKQRRALANLSQRALAKQMGVDRSQIALLEQGRRNLTVIWLVQFSRALGCTVFDLIDEATA